MMHRLLLPALAASLALAATAPIAADLASANDEFRPRPPDRHIVHQLRAEIRRLEHANAELQQGLDQIEDASRYLRDRRAARRIAWLVQDTRDRAGVVHTMPYPDYGSTAREMTPEAFSRLTQAVNKASFPDDQLALIRTAAPQSYFTSAQVAALMKLSPFDRTRIEIAVVCAPRVVDADRWFEVEAALDFRSSREELRKRVPQLVAPTRE